jgi:5S rRNA maturation endonuclease (ribonuclease M5)
MNTSNGSEIRYPYKDEHNELLYIKVKVTEPEKSYYWLRRENGELVYNVKGCRKIPYRLPELLYGISKGMPIFLVEGEKDVDNLLALPLIATCTSGSLEWSGGFTDLLKDSHVVILYDYDRTGYKRRDMLTKELSGRVKRLQVLDLGFEYTESHGKDVSDWIIDHGMNAQEQLMRLVETTPDYVAPNALRLINIGQFFELKIPKRKMLLDPIIPSQSLTLLAARRGVGKTHVALGLAFAISTGARFLKWIAPEPKKVLYIDGEMPAILMQERLEMVAQMSDHQTIPENFGLLTPDLQPRPLPNLGTAEGQEEMNDYIKDYDFIVFDNLSSLFRSGSENEAEGWQQIQEWALALRKQGKSLLFVHHLGKNGTQRGTSKREDTVDTIITLREPDDYRTSDGARFEVHFEKARHFYGDDAKPFEVELQESNNKYWWQLNRRQ